MLQGGDDADTFLIYGGGLASGASFSVPTSGNHAVFGGAGTDDFDVSRGFSWIRDWDDGEQIDVDFLQTTGSFAPAVVGSSGGFLGRKTSWRQRHLAFELDLRHHGHADHRRLRLPLLPNLRTTSASTTRLSAKAVQTMVRRVAHGQRFGPTNRCSRTVELNQTTTGGRGPAKMVGRLHCEA